MGSGPTGGHGVISAKQARRRAALAISRIKSGQPAAVSTMEPKGPTVAEVAARYLKEHVEVRLKPATVRMIRRDLDRYILPKFGSLPMVSVGYGRIAAYHSKLFRVPTMANRMVETLSAMFSMAETWGDVPEGANPCPRVVRYKRRSRERFLTEGKFERLGRVLSDMEAEETILPRAAAALRLLMLTGCRCNEILRLRWDEVDLERNELRLSDSKTGPRTVPLSPAAARVLENRPRVPGEPWVIPGRFPGRPLRNIDRSWRKVRARAGLKGVRLHDLRHSFASRALALGGEPADDREAVGPHEGAHDREIRAPSGGFGERIGAEGRGKHRRRHSAAMTAAAPVAPSRREVRTGAAGAARTPFPWRRRDI